MLPPEHLIAMLNKRFPRLWQDIDECRAKHSKSWPGWCFIRRDELADIIESYQSSPPSNDDQRMKHFSRIRLATILAPWRVSKTVYRFDPDIYHALIQTSLRGNLPVELLLRLPEWAVYIETPGLDTYFGPSQGFVASLNYSPRTDGQVTLSLLSLNVDAFSLPFGPTLPSCVRMKGAEEEMVDGVAEGAVRSRKAKGLFHQHEDGFAWILSPGTPYGAHRGVREGTCLPPRLQKAPKMARPPHSS